MRPWVPLVLAFAALVSAQGGGGSNNVVNNPASGIQASAGQPLTLSWTNPSSGTITIKIQTSGSIQPTDGIVVAQNIPNTGSATFTIPPDIPVGQVFVQIINDSNPSDYNFSGGFQVQGATNTATALTAASTASAASSSISSNSASSASSASESSASSASSASSSSASMSMSSASASSSSSSASASSASASALSSRSSASASRTSASSASAQSTAAPTNAAMSLQVQGGLVAAMLGAAVLL